MLHGARRCKRRAVSCRIIDARGRAMAHCARLGRGPEAVSGSERGLDIWLLIRYPSTTNLRDLRAIAPAVHIEGRS